MALSQRRRRLVAGLRQRKTREREGLVLVEGVRAVNEALDAHVDVRFAVTSPKLVTTDEGVALSERLGTTPIEGVSDDELTALADTTTPQGVLLVCRQPRLDLGDLPANRLLIVDGVQDPGNTGTLIRAAVAFGLDGVVCLDGTADPWGAKTVRASAGLVFRCRVTRAGASETLEHLAAVGTPLLVADASGRDVERHRGAPRFALVVGNEGAGVRSELETAAADVVAVPMTGPAESLNVGVAGSILMHTLTREQVGG